MICDDIKIYFQHVSLTFWLKKKTFSGLRNGNSYSNYKKFYNITIKSLFFNVGCLKVLVKYIFIDRKRVKQINKDDCFDLFVNMMRHSHMLVSVFI